MSLAIYCALLFIFGTAIGSFLNVLTARLPKGESLGGRSHCPHCGHQLVAKDLVPVLSYLSLRGKCRYCHSAVSPRYMVIELATGSLFALCGVFFTLPTGDMSALLLARALFIVAVAVTVFVIDLERYEILDSILLVSCAVVFILNVAVPGLLVPSLFAALGAFVFFGLLYLTGGRGKLIGFGDVKLGIFLGLATPGLAVAANIFLAYLIGAACAIPLLALGKKSLKSAVPFGTFLAASTVVTLYVGPQLVAWYLHLIGI